MTKPSVLITGVSSGIGYELAKHYLQQGSRVLGISRREPTDLLTHPDFDFRSIDLADLETIAKSLKELLAEASDLDLVILNAGVLGRIADLREQSLAELQRTMDVNLWANKLVLDAIFPCSGEGTGRQVRQVVLISSGAAVNGNRGWGGYSLSKAALNMLAKLYAAELPGVHFSAVAPGLVDTAMQEQLRSEPRDPRFPSLEALRAKHQTPDMPTPQELATRLAGLFTELPDRIGSGDFIDIRTLAPR